MSFSPTGLARTYILDQSAVLNRMPEAASATGELPLAQIIIPGGAMGPNGIVRVSAVFSHTNNGNSKTMRVRFGGIGGIAMGAVSATANDKTAIITQIWNRGVTNSQVSNNVVFSGSSNTAPPTSSVETMIDAVLVISGQKATGTDTLTLEAYLVELIARAQ